MTSQTQTASLDFPSAVDYVRRTLRLNDMKVHSVALSADNEGCIDVDFDFIPDAAGVLDRRPGRMTVWVERDGQLYGEW